MRRVAEWARDRDDVRALALVGSWARGARAATDPVDPGTRRVVGDGLRILHDPDGLLARLLEACSR